MKDKKIVKQDLGQEHRTSSPSRYGLDSPYIQNHENVPKSGNSVQDDAVRFKLLLLEIGTLIYYVDKLEDLLIRTQNRIKHVKDGRRDYLTVHCLMEFEAFYSRNHTLCKNVLSETEDNIFGSGPGLQYS